MTTALRAARGGTAYGRIDGALRGFAQYDDFRRGLIRRADYCAWIRASAGFLADLGLDEEQANLSTRFPRHERGHVAGVLADLAGSGVVDAVDYPEEEFAWHRDRVAARWTHDGRTAYVFPEEARLLYALAHLLRPRHAVFVGGDHGYWAAWALPAVVAAGGRATLVDADPAARRLAARNLAALGVAGAVDFRAGGFQAGDVDLCVLDTRPGDGTSYRSRAEEITPVMAPGGVLVAHHMLLQNLTDNPYLTRRIAHNVTRYAPFHQYLERHYGARRAYPTTAGLGVYRRSPAGRAAAVLEAAA
jgi:predicted O-methyltransferase YrrM